MNLTIVFFFCIQIFFLSVTLLLLPFGIYKMPIALAAVITGVVTLISYSLSKEGLAELSLFRVETEPAHKAKRNVILVSTIAILMGYVDIVPQSFPSLGIEDIGTKSEVIKGLWILVLLYFGSSYVSEILDEIGSYLKERKTRLLKEPDKKFNASTSGRAEEEYRNTQIILQTGVAPTLLAVSLQFFFNLIIPFFLYVLGLIGLATSFEWLKTLIMNGLAIY